MTPAARIAAAIGILDEVLDGAPAEKVLTNWARGNRYAGSGDRAAIRDHVYDALRCRRSFGWLGGGEDGRALMIGALRAAGTDPADLFTGDRFAPAPLTPEEAAGPVLADAPQAVRLDLPDWLLSALTESLGTETEPVLQALKSRAPVFLRVNAARSTPAEAQQALAAEGIATRPHPLAPEALEVTENPRRVQGSAAYLTGIVELQDAASQAICAALPKAGRVLDYCAGGGGKSLSMAAGGAAVWAHDAEPRRMRDLPARAERAGVTIPLIDAAGIAREAPFDMVLCDAPCSGSGTWRRTPEAKWTLTQDRLDALCAIQAEILAKTPEFVRPGGTLAYVTCSLLRAENEDQAQTFLAAHPGWTLEHERRLSPLDGGDGFYLAVFRAPGAA